MDELDPDLEDCYSHEVYVEFQFEEWPLLTTLDETLRKQLCAEVSDALAAVECKVLAIRANSDVLQLVLKLDVNVSLDEVIDFVRNAGRNVAKVPNDEGQPSYSVDGLDPRNTLEAVMQLHSG